MEGKLDTEDIKNLIPEPVVTPPPRIPQQPFDYDGDVYIGATTEERQEEGVLEEDEEEEEDEEDVDNQLNPRGDVFSKCHFHLTLIQASLFLIFWVVHNVLPIHILNKLSFVLMCTLYLNTIIECLVFCKSLA